MSNDSPVVDENPKDAIGSRKVPMSVLPGPVLAETACGLFEGALKYGRHNYRLADIRASVYYDATMRHLMDFWEGEDTDPDSALSHITKAIASLMVFRDGMMNGKWIDDRPPRPADPDWLKKLNERVVALIEKYPEPRLPCTEANKHDYDFNQ